MTAQTVATAPERNTSKTQWPQWRLALGALLLAGMASSSHAQFGGAGGSRQHGNPNAGTTQRVQSRWEQVSGRMYDLRVQLLITREQSVAWENFRGRFLDMATTGSGGQPIVDEQTAKDAFQQLLYDTQRRSNLLATLDAAAQTLLAQLSPEQLHIADRALPALLAEFGNNR